MGGVIDGQPVNQAVTNPAFLYKNADDTSSARYTLSAASSGPQVDNVQNSINVLLSGVGGTQSIPATAYAGVPGNTIFAGDTHQVALIELAQKFFGAASAGGHTHSGVDGMGPTIASVLSVAASTYAPLTGNIIIAGSGGATVTESGNTIYVSAPTQGVTSIAASGASLLTGAVTVQGSSGIQVSQSGQNIIVSTYDTRTINLVSASAYTFVLTDGSQTGLDPLVAFTSASAASATVPLNASVAFPVGAMIDLIQDGAGSVTVLAASGVTLYSESGNRTIFAQYVAAQLIQKSVDNWWLIGNLTT